MIELTFKNCDSQESVTYLKEIIEEFGKTGFLSPSIKQIIFSTNIESEINSLMKQHNKEFIMHKGKGYAVAGQNICLDDKFYVFLDLSAAHPNNPESNAFIKSQLISVYVGEYFDQKFPIQKQLNPETSLPDATIWLYKIWGEKHLTEKILDSLDINITSKLNIKSYTHNLKCEIRKLAYKYQSDNNIDQFWIYSMRYLNFFIKRCLEIKNHTEYNELGTFHELIDELISELAVQAKAILDSLSFSPHNLQKIIVKFFQLFGIQVTQTEKGLHLKVFENPKDLFKKEIIDTEPRIVAFIDILGFSKMIEKYDNNEWSDLLFQINEAVEQAVSLGIEQIHKMGINDDIKNHFEYYMFSDCLCMSLPYIDFDSDFQEQFYLLASIVQSYQTIMMHKGFQVRGGICHGSYFANGKMIFSGALVNAYKIETKAINPIVAIHKDTLDRLTIKMPKNKQAFNFDKLIIQTNTSYKKSDENICFLNPFHSMDNSKETFEYLKNTGLSALSDLESEIQKDPINSSLISLSKKIISESYNKVNDSINDNSIDDFKKIVMANIISSIKDLEYDLQICHNDDKEDIEKVISKYVYIKSYLEWHSGDSTRKEFSYFKFHH